ncbi:hypothetical protein [Vreelandella janggokensis]|uniref:hypothetical protein n=1 Tax=Vreelandella janggokensis TaxID=370767 RepID=UPI0028607EB4|nr:hypothetical protein [Halomonas janggokensis]MDR5887325.1 hypothetical protein [Halomonas janggokensis]
MSLSKRITTFEGIFCSGFLIPDQRHVTALSLLFDKVHFLNQLEYVIEFSKKYHLTLNNEENLPKIRLTPSDPNSDEDPLSELTTEQKETVHKYLIASGEFFYRNSQLFSDLFQCSLLPDDGPVSVELIEEGKKGEKNLYKVTRNELVVCTGSEDEMAGLINSGCVPIFMSGAQFTPRKTGGVPNTKQIAANIALSSVAMVLPSTKAARPDDIMEAREQLRDHLPNFWSSMLKLSSEVNSKIEPDASPLEIKHQIDELITATVTPALIDLSQKLEMERKNRFRRILTSTAKGLRVLAGRPPTDLAGLVSGSLLGGADAAMDFANQLRKVEALKQESGMSYLLELDKIASKNS